MKSYGSMQKQQQVSNFSMLPPCNICQARDGLLDLMEYGVW